MNMARLHGRRERGQRLLSKAPAGHWNTTTMIAAAGLEGVTAPFALEGTVDAEAIRRVCRTNSCVQPCVAARSWCWKIWVVTNIRVFEN